MTRSSGSDRRTTATRAPSTTPCPVATSMFKRKYHINSRLKTSESTRFKDTSTTSYVSSTARLDLHLQSNAQKLQAKTGLPEPTTAGKPATPRRTTAPPTCAGTTAGQGDETNLLSGISRPQSSNLILVFSRSDGRCSPATGTQRWPEIMAPRTQHPATMTQLHLFTHEFHPFHGDYTHCREFAQAVAQGLRARHGPCTGATVVSSLRLLRRCRLTPRQPQSRLPAYSGSNSNALDTTTPATFLLAEPGPFRFKDCRTNVSRRFGDHPARPRDAGSAIPAREEPAQLCRGRPSSPSHNRSRTGASRIPTVAHSPRRAQCLPAAFLLQARADGEPIRANSHARISGC